MAQERIISLDTERLSAHLARQSDVVFAYLFGSVARGQADPLSDVDLAVLLDGSLGHEERLERQLRLMADLADCAGCEVEIVLLNDAPPLLCYEVVEEGIPLYDRDRAERIAFETMARRIYFDWQPWEDYHTRALLKDIKEVGLSERGAHRSRALEAARRIHHRLTGFAGR